MYPLGQNLHRPCFSTNRGWWPKPSCLISGKGIGTVELVFDFIFMGVGNDGFPHFPFGCFPFLINAVIKYLSSSVQFVHTAVCKSTMHWQQKPRACNILDACTTSRYQCWADTEISTYRSCQAPTLMLIVLMHNFWTRRFYDFLFLSWPVLNQETFPGPIKEDKSWTRPLSSHLIMTKFKLAAYQ